MFHLINNCIFSDVIKINDKLILAKPSIGSPAAALFFVGGVLVGIDVKGRLGAIGAVAIGKLVLNSLLVAGFIFLLPDFDRQLQVSAIIIAAAPMLAIYPIIGSRCGMEQESASKLLVATVASFVTISVILHFLA